MAGDDPDHRAHEYPKQASNVDVARILLELPTPAQVVRAIQLLHKEHRVRRVKNRFSPEHPLYGYRDILVNLDIDGIIVEAQLGLGPLVELRAKMHHFYNIVRAIGFRPYLSVSKIPRSEQVGYWVANQMRKERKKFDDEMAKERELERSNQNDSEEHWNCDMCNGKNSAHKRICG
jgi:hypothetical protein